MRRLRQRGSLGLVLLSAVVGAHAADRLESLLIAPAAAEAANTAVAAGDLPEAVLKPSRELRTDATADREQRTVFIRADRISGLNEVKTVADGNVELRRAGTSLIADHVTFWSLEDELDAAGNVRLVRDDDAISGPHLHMNVRDFVGVFDQPSYALKRAPRKDNVPFALPREPITGSGEASRIDFEGEGLYKLKSATYSTCAPSSRDWYAEAVEISLDYNREIGEASSARVVFKDVPILYTPWLSFSLNEKRKSGLLAPTIGTSTSSGLDVTLPWYWDIAPNMDATIAPRMMARRGLQLNSEFRYLEQSYNGLARFEYLPRDQLTGKTRTAYSLLHDQVLAPGLVGNVNVNGVSDDSYFTDLSSRVSMVSQANLLRQGTLTYSTGWWNATLMAQRYQTLQDPAAPVAIPYYRMPQLTVNASRPDLPVGLAFNFNSEFVNFGHPTLVTGQRLIAYPQISLPMQTAAFFFTPKIGMHITRYSLDRRADGVPAQIDRQLPILSADVGAVLERPVNWFDRSLTQTLEPRVYYLQVPNRDQSKIPTFDSGLADFNFAQIFSENRYGGSDRIGDANQLTAAVVSRLIDPNTGAELVRGAIGQRFYFNTQQVTLPGEIPRTDRKTDLLAAFSGRVVDRVFVDTAWQYNPSLSRTQTLNLGARYQPEIGKVLNAGYRYTRDQLGQIDISGQWPLSGGWHGVGRYNYSTKDRKLIESLGGIEYDGGCWVARVVFHRLATTTTQATTALFFQLELNGLGRIGANPLDMLRRSIPGYGVINQPTADPVFGAY